MQSTRSFPAEVYRAAQAHGLDAPSREYADEPEPTGRVFRKGFQAWDCSNGLVYQQGGSFQAIRWEQLATITRQTAWLSSTFVTIRYLVQPESAPAFDFTLLRDPYARWIKPQKRTGGYTILNGGEVEFSWSGSILWIVGTRTLDLSAYAGLGELLEAQLVSQRLPGVLDACQSAAGVSFGPLVVSRQGITDGARVLFWHEISSIEISQCALQIAKKPTGLVYLDFSLLDFPNVALLEALLTSARAQFLENELPPG